MANLESPLYSRCFLTSDFLISEALIAVFAVDKAQLKRQTATRMDKVIGESQFVMLPTAIWQLLHAACFGQFYKS